MQRLFGGDPITGLPFDDRLWVCGYCKAVCVDYPTMKEHKEKRCRVRKAVLARQAEMKRIPMVSMPSVVEEGQKVLEAWGLR